MGSKIFESSEVVLLRCQSTETFTTYSDWELFFFFNLSLSRREMGPAPGFNSGTRGPNLQKVSTQAAGDQRQS